jgi:hypothetical protein
MATEINLKKGSILKKGYVGFSWTTLFFGFIVPLVRGNWKWCAIILALEIITAYSSNLVFAFIFNKIDIKELLEQGYEPADEVSRLALVSKGFISA